MKYMQELYTTIQDIRNGKSEKAIEKLIELRDEVKNLTDENIELKNRIEELKKNLNFKSDTGKLG